MAIIFYELSIYIILGHCRDLLWLFVLFISVAAIGTRFLTAMCLGFGLLWNIPLIGNYVDPAIAFCLWFLLEAMQACVRLKGAIVELVGSISNMVLAAMRKMPMRMW